MAVDLLPFALAHAGDAAGLAAALARPGVRDARLLVLLAKVAGPATLNDPSRELAQLVFRAALGPALLERTRMILSVGCEGVGSAGGWLLVDDGAADAGTAERLALGTAETAPIAMADRGGPAHVAAVAEAVAAAMREARLDADAVRLVLLKSPVRRDQAEATGRARGAAALGAAVALGELHGEITAATIADPARFATRAMAMSGTETDRAEVVVLGNRAGAGGGLIVGSGVLRDLIDLPGARLVLASMGAAFDADGVLADAEAVPLVLFKAGLAADGTLRGRRTQVLGTDLPADKHLRAAASGMLAGLLGSTDAFISGGAEHQGPPGACLLAAVARVAA